MVVLPDMLQANAIKLIHCSTDSDRSGNTGLAGLAFVRCLLVGGLVKIDAQDHVVAALMRRHRVQKLAPALARANARRDAKIGAGKDQKIAVYLLHIKRQGSHLPGGINEHCQSELPRARTSATGFTVPKVLET